MKNKFRSQQGSTLIEIMVATSVVVFALTALMTTLTLSIKTTAESKYRSYATALAQEALEVYRRERALLGWDSFYGAANTGAYCYNTLPATTQEFVAKSLGNCSDRFVQVGTDFSRTVNVSKAADAVTVESVVDWYDGEEVRSVSLQQILKEY